MSSINLMLDTKENNSLFRVLAKNDISDNCHTLPVCLCPIPGILSN